MALPPPYPTATLESIKESLGDNPLAKLEDLRPDDLVLIAAFIQTFNFVEFNLRRSVSAFVQAGLVEPKENNYLAAVARRSAVGISSMALGATVSGSSQRTSQSKGAAEPLIGLAFVDLSTGEFRTTEFSGEKAEARLRDELGVLRPREILLPDRKSVV